jgi:hypothetical protein
MTFRWKGIGVWNIESHRSREMGIHKIAINAKGMERK